MGFTDDDDEYMVEAAKLIIKTDRASVGLLQREFKIGFNRALRIMETLEKYGVVSGEGIFKQRKVLMGKKEFDDLLSRIEISGELPQKTEDIQFTQPEKENMYNNQYDYMSGEDFEVFVAHILRKIGFIDIKLTKASGDQGVDIIAEKDGIKYAIQCKKYSQPVGNKAVQEVFAGKTFYHCHVGVVITNSYFTQSAKELANENGIVLWDKDFLDKYTLENKEEVKKIDNSIIERIYYINGDFTIFSLKENNKIEILGICETSASAANLYLTLYINLKEEWSGKIDFVVAVNFGNAVAIATNENGVEFFGGKELNGEIAIGIPDWMDKARDEFLSKSSDEVMNAIEEAKKYLQEFMLIVVNYIN